MSAHVRKLIGTIMLLIFMVLYLAIAAAIGSGRISEANGFAPVCVFPDCRALMGDPRRASHPLDGTPRLIASRGNPALGRIHLLEPVPNGEWRARQIKGRVRQFLELPIQ